MIVSMNRFIVIADAAAPVRAIDGLAFGATLERGFDPSETR